jgi:hypothetical protein
VVQDSQLGMPLMIEGHPQGVCMIIAACGIVAS